MDIVLLYATLFIKIVFSQTLSQNLPTSAPSTLEPTALSVFSSFKDSASSELTTSMPRVTISPSVDNSIHSGDTHISDYSSTIHSITLSSTVRISTTAASSIPTTSLSPMSVESTESFVTTDSLSLTAVPTDGISPTAVLTDSISTTAVLTDSLSPTTLPPDSFSPTAVPYSFTNSISLSTISYHVTDTTTKPPEPNVAQAVHQECLNKVTKLEQDRSVILGVLLALCVLLLLLLIASCYRLRRLGDSLVSFRKKYDINDL